MRRLCALVALPVLALTAACASDAPTEPSGLAPDETFLAHAENYGSASAVRQLLAEVRQATTQYHDVEAARADGYVPLHGCVPGMGFHFLRPDLVDGQFDPRDPEVLVYEARGEDELILVAVEYLSTAEERPAFAGMVDFEDFFDPNVANFALHAWIWKGNPDGAFHHSNPTVSCPGGGDHHRADAPSHSRSGEPIWSDATLFMTQSAAPALAPGRSGAIEGGST